MTRHTRHQVSRPAAMKTVLPWVCHSPDLEDRSPSLSTGYQFIHSTTFHLRPIFNNTFSPPCYSPRVPQAHSCTCTAHVPTHTPHERHAPLQHALSTPAPSCNAVTPARRLRPSQGAALPTMPCSAISKTTRINRLINFKPRERRRGQVVFSKYLVAISTSAVAVSSGNDSSPSTASA